MELLDEIWRLIFAEHLDLLETVRCRRVSKRFKCLVDQLRPTKLTVYGHNLLTCKDFRDHRSPPHWIQLYRFGLEPNSSFQILFANLKVLELDFHLGNNLGEDEGEFNLELLNEFDRLEKLYLNTVVICRTQTLRLPNLRVLSIGLYSQSEQKLCPNSWQERIDYSQQPRLVLDSKVQKLLCQRTTLLVFEHPDCVEVLQCDRQENLERNPPTRFKNLRVLCVPYSALSESILSIFEDLESLEELHLGWIKEEESLLFNQLMAKRAALRRKVKIYASDVCLLSEESLRTSINVRGNDPMKFKIQNYHQLADRVLGVKSVWYKHLIELLDTFTPYQIELDEWRFPICFFEKFRNIQIVSVNRVVGDEGRFLWFLSRCNRITELSFVREFLTQSLLDRLPAACGTLKGFNLKVLTYTRGPSSGLDLRPLYGLKQLFVLRIDSNDASLDSLDLLALFESCKYLAWVKLNYILIMKRKLYHVSTPGKTFLELTPYRISTFFSERAAFNYEDLRRNLGTIIEDCKKIRKRTSLPPIWQAVDYSLQREWLFTPTPARASQRPFALTSLLTYLFELVNWIHNLIMDC